MTAITVPLLARSEFNASFLGSGAEQVVTLSTINLVPFDYCTLIVRVHDATWSTGAYFRVEGYASYPTPDDPREFVDSSAGIAAMVFQTAALPGVGIGTASSLPPAYKFLAKIRMSSSASSCFAVVSVDLLLRAKNRRGNPPGACRCSHSEANSRSKPFVDLASRLLSNLSSAEPAIG